MTRNMLTDIRDGNLKDLNFYYEQELENYTNLYKNYLEKVSGNDDDKLQAEKDLKPKIIEKNKLLIDLANVFLENNQRSSQLIEQDYKTIESKNKQIQNLKKSYENLEIGVVEENKSEEVKIQKRIENVEGVTSKNKIILSVLTVINILLLTVLVVGIVMLSINKKNV